MATLSRTYTFSTLENVTWTGSPAGYSIYFSNYFQVELSGKNLSVTNGKINVPVPIGSGSGQIPAGMKITQVNVNFSYKVTLSTASPVDGFFLIVNDEALMDVPNPNTISSSMGSYSSFSYTVDTSEMDDLNIVGASGDMMLGLLFPSLATGNSILARVTILLDSLSYTLTYETASEAYNGSGSLSHGQQMSLSINKGGQKGISLSHGIQMSATYTATEPETYSGTGTLSHGPQMTAMGQKSGRSPPHSDSLGLQMALVPRKGKILILAISHGQQVSGAGKKTGKGSGTQTLGLQMSVSRRKGSSGTGSQTLGIQSSLTGSKKASQGVLFSLGPQTTGTGKKTATGATAFSMGLQMEVIGERPSVHSIALHHGINLTSTGKKSISSSLEVSHGAQIATASFKASNRLIETSLGVNVQTQGQGGKKATGALTASHGDQVLGNGIKTGKRTVAVTLGDHESSTSHKGGTGESTLSHGIHLTVLSGAQIGGVIQIHHGAQMSATGTKSSARVVVVEVGIKVSMIPKKGTKTAIGLTQGLEGSSYGYKQIKQAVVHSMGDRILTLWTRNSSGLVFSGGGVGIHYGATKGIHGEEETSLGIVILIEFATGEIYRVYDSHHVTLQEPESHILQIQPRTAEQTVGEASSVSVVKQEAHNRLTIREPGAIVITIHEKK